MEKGLRLKGLKFLSELKMTRTAGCLLGSPGEVSHAVECTVKDQLQTLKIGCPAGPAGVACPLGAVRGRDSSRVTPVGRAVPTRAGKCSHASTPCFKICAILPAYCMGSVTELGMSMHTEKVSKECIIS